MRITAAFVAVLREIKCKEFWVYYGNGGDAEGDFDLDIYKKGDDIYRLCDEFSGWQIVSMQLLDGNFVIEVVP